MKVEKYLREAVKAPDKQKKKAFDDYKKLNLEANKLLNSLRTKLVDHQNKFFSGKGPNYGYIGDLGKVVKDLKELDKFMP